MSIYIEIGAEIMHYAQHMYFIGTLYSFVEHSRIHNFVSFEGSVLAFFLWMASAQYKKTNKENREREWKSQYLNSGNWKSVEIRSCFNKWAADVSRTNWPITIYKLTIHCEKTMLDTRLHIVLLNNRPIAQIEWHYEFQRNNRKEARIKPNKLNLYFFRGAFNRVAQMELKWLYRLFSFCLVGVELQAHSWPHDTKESRNWIGFLSFWPSSSTEKRD